MIVGVVSEKDWEYKLEEAIQNTRDRGERTLTFIVKSTSIERIVNNFREDSAFMRLNTGVGIVFLFKELRIEVKSVDYYV
jgi:hypothetical protein